MKKSRFLIIAVLLIASLFAISCDDEESDPITMRIFCYGSEFSGWYIIDGERPVFFADTEFNSGVYYTELIINDMEELEVEVVTSDLTASSLAIKLYRDETKVKEVSQSGSGSIILINLTYVFGESEEES